MTAPRQCGRVPLALIIGTVLVLSLAAAAAAEDEATVVKRSGPRVCHRGKAVYANRVARLYKRRYSGVLQLFGCANPAGREVYLGNVDPDPENNSGYLLYRLTDRFAVLAGGGYDTQTGIGSAGTDIVDLRTGRDLRPRYDVPFVDAAIQRIVADGRPQAAWIESGTTTAGPIRVVAQDQRGVRVLDSGPQVVPSSLRLAHGLLQWCNGTETRRARLVGSIRAVPYR